MALPLDYIDRADKESLSCTSTGGNNVKQVQYSREHVYLASSQFIGEI